MERSIFSAHVRHLRLNHVDSTVEMRTRLVEYGGGVAYSWHGSLAEYDQEAGLLTLDGGRALAVVVDGQLLCPATRRED
jgi:hypothetical protein